MAAAVAVGAGLTSYEAPLRLCSTLLNTKSRQLRRQRLRQEAPCGGAGFAVALERVLCSVRSGDSETLAGLLQDGALETVPNPRVQDISLQQLLGTNAAQFPLLWVAAFSGGPSIFEAVAVEISKHRCLKDQLQEDVEGWLLPLVICCGQQEPLETLRRYFCICGTDLCKDRPLLRHCLVRDGGIDPLKLLLFSKDPSSNGDTWPHLVTLLVEQGGGFPHDEAVETMILVGRHLVAQSGDTAYRQLLMSCSLGGDPVRPRTSAFAGLFLGLLDATVSSTAALDGLRALVDAGLSPEEPLAGGDGLWPVHAAARHDCPDMVLGLLALGADQHAKNHRGQSPMDVALAAHSNRAVAALRHAATCRPQWDEVIAQATAASVCQEWWHEIGLVEC